MPFVPSFIQCFITLISIGYPPSLQTRWVVINITSFASLTSPVPKNLLSTQLPRIIYNYTPTQTLCTNTTQSTPAILSTTTSPIFRMSCCSLQAFGNIVTEGNTLCGGAMCMLPAPDGPGMRSVGADGVWEVSGRVPTRFGVERRAQEWPHRMHCT